MDDEEIAARINDLSDQARNELYRICQVREDHGVGPDVAEYVEVDVAVADELSTADLVWRAGSYVAARHDVFRYWQRSVRDMAA